MVAGRRALLGWGSSSSGEHKGRPSCLATTHEPQTESRNHVWGRLGRRWGFFPICQGGRGDRCCQTALRGLGRRTLRMIELKRKRSIPQELDWDDEDETEEDVVPACVLSEHGAERALDALTEASEPHAREHCPTFPFAPGLELDYCHQCTCAAPPIPAEVRPLSPARQCACSAHWRERALDHPPTLQVLCAMCPRPSA